MKKLSFLVIIISVFLCSCVSQSEHDKIISEKDAIAQERDKLRQELEEIKFGAPHLLSDGKMFYESKDFTQARQKFQMLIEKHSDMPESIEAKKYLTHIDEDELWNRASSSEDISLSDQYISKYPNGNYLSNATARRNQLLALNLQKAYEYASSQNTSYAWKKFLEDYPNHDEANAIRKRIISLEVDEISRDKTTGEMPTFSQLGSSYSANSAVEITNNTGCELTVRYSGPDVEMIIIPAGGTQSVYLSSGNYKIAASACGSNYAGLESLYGRYGSTFYIRRTTY